MSPAPRHCGIDWNGRFRCGRPGCDRCRRRQILRECRAVMERLDAGECQFVPVTIRFDTAGEIRAAIAKIRSDLRNRLNLCRATKRWSEVAIWGWLALLDGEAGQIEISAHAIVRIGLLLGRADVHDAIARTWDKTGQQVEVGAAACSDALPKLARDVVEKAYAHGGRFEGHSNFRSLRFRYGRTHKPTARKAFVYEPMPILF
jgi:hypothetical protein